MGVSFAATPLSLLLYHVAVTVAIDVDVVSINLIYSTTEPIFAKIAGYTVTIEHHAELDSAIAALSPAYRLNPTACSSWTAVG